jgi:hypothetical protein
LRKNYTRKFWDDQNYILGVGDDRRSRRRTPGRASLPRNFLYGNFVMTRSTKRSSRPEE